MPGNMYSHKDTRFNALPIYYFSLLVVIACTAFAQTTPDRTRRVYTNDDVSQERSTSAAQSTDESEPVQGSEGRTGPGRVAPFVPTPMDVVQKMLEIAGVTSVDTVYDLGSGDGRIVFAAAEKYGAKAVGVELNKDLARISEEEAKRRQLDRLVTIIQGDLFEANVKPATVVAVYLLQAANRQLSPILEKDLAPGTRVVAHDIRIPDWRPVEEVSVESSGVQHFIYLYRVPESFRK